MYGIDGHGQFVQGQSRLSTGEGVTACAHRAPSLFALQVIPPLPQLTGPQALEQHGRYVHLPITLYRKPELFC